MTEPIQPQRGTCLIDNCPRDPRHGLVCGPDRQRIRDMLDELVDLWPLLPDETATQSGGINLLALDLMTPVPSVLNRRQAAGQVHDTMLPRYRTTARPIVDPASGDVLGKIWDRRPVLGPDGAQQYAPAGDQHGGLPLTIWADQWVLFWREQRAQRGTRERLPVPTIDRLVGYLRGRIDWAADTTGTAVDDLAAELREQVAMLRRVTHMAPQRLAAVCPACDRRALIRWPNSRWDECRYCRNLVSRGEYDDIADAELEAIGGAA